MFVMLLVLGLAQRRNSVGFLLSLGGLAEEQGCSQGVAAVPRYL